MSLRQLGTRIEHLERLEAKCPEPVNAVRARWEELRLRQWKQENRPNEVEKLTEAEEAELNELTYRFHPGGSFLKALDEALAQLQLERSRQLELEKKAVAPK